jgi:hypothetical protein
LAQHEPGGRLRSCRAWLVISGDGISIADTSAPEAFGAETFHITRTDSTDAASVDWRASDGTAVAPSDYRPRSGTVSFAPGETTTGSVRA